MNTAVCCNQCFESIARKDPMAAHLWLDLCAYFVKLEGLFKLRETRVPWTIPQFRNLEILGFISTADGQDGVIVRVNGYDIIEDGDLCLDTFCLDREEHKSSWI